MKKIFYILFVLVPFISLSQKKATLEDGTKVILFPDGTWKPESELVNIGTSATSDTSKIFISLSSYSSVLSEPNLYSSEIKDFPKSKIEAIDFLDGYFAVRSTDGKIGYVHQYSVNEREEKSQRVIDKIVHEAVLKGKKLIIRNLKIEEINSADGVDFSIEWINANQNKTIKYIFFTVIPYNAVGDIQSCKITGRSEFTGKVTGPIKPDSNLQTSYWETAWYNSTIDCLKMTKVEVKYMDGSTDLYIKDLPAIIDKTMKNKCL